MSGTNIKIMFYPGTHGNFLIFVLNKCLLGQEFPIDDPFNQLGTSHDRMWAVSWDRFKNQTHFRGYHQDKIDLLQENEKFIKIDFDPSDDMFVMQLILKRGADGVIDVNDICKNTYHKLSQHLHPQARAIIDHANRYKDISPYYNIKDDSWPDINTVDDFFRLPQKIINECKNIFGFNPIELKPERPDAPRWVLRNIFKSWVQDKNFAPAAEMEPFDLFPGVYKFDLRSFYAFDAMKHELEKIGHFFNLKLDLNNFSKSLHDKFIERVPFRDTRQQCDRILEAIDRREDIEINLNVFCEGYLDYLIEEKFCIKMPLHHEKYFSSSLKILNYIETIKAKGAASIPGGT